MIFTSATYSILLTIVTIFIRWKGNMFSWGTNFQFHVKCHIPWKQRYENKTPTSSFGSSWFRNPSKECKIFSWNMTLTDSLLSGLIRCPVCFSRDQIVSFRSSGTLGNHQEKQLWGIYYYILNGELGISSLWTGWCYKNAIHTIYNIANAFWIFNFELDKRNKKVCRGKKFWCHLKIVQPKFIKLVIFNSLLKIV